MALHRIAGEMRRSIAAEWEAMFSGHFVPYQILSIIVAVITSFAFSIAMSHDAVFEAPVAVVDLDQSRWSASFIEELNASPMISVQSVSHAALDAHAVRGLTRTDSAIGVIYIPKGAQARLVRGDRTLTIGYYADDSNSAQNGELFSTLNEIAAHVGANIAISRSDGVSTLGRSDNETAAMISPLRVSFRYLTNPTGQATTGTVVGFLFFFGLMFHGLTSLMIVGRLRVTHEWDSRVLSGSVFAFLSRAVPYAFIYTCVITVAIAILTLVGQLRFAGNVFLFLPALFLAAIGNTWLAALISWNCTNPGQGASRMIWLVPPGFILGGATMALGFVHAWVHWASFGIPLVWVFTFWRNIGLRGTTLLETLPLFGAQLCWLIFLATLVAVRFWKDERERAKKNRESWHALSTISRECVPAENVQLPESHNAPTSNAWPTETPEALVSKPAVVSSMPPVARSATQSA